MSDGALFQIFIYLAAAAVAVPIAQRIGLGSVLGYLIAGCVIGPYVLGLVGDQTDVMHAAEFGVFILLFLIGLEMRPQLLWRMKRVFAMGGSHVLLTGAALTGGAMLLGLDWRQAIAAGLILALSSTAIALQTLDEHNLRNREAGRTAFGVLLFEDLAVIPLFAILPLLAMLPASGAAEAAAHSDDLLTHAPGWVQAAGTVGAVVAVLVINRFLARPLFRFIAKAGKREVFTIAALLIVVGVTVLMQSVGLSPALGAFLAGVVLGDSEYRREIESDIEPFRGLFLGLFFITIGAGVDLGAIASQPFVIIGLVLGLMVFKAAMLFTLSRLFGFGTQTAAGVAASLSQGSEFAFVLLAFAFTGGVLARETTELLTVVVALSMATTPLVMTLYSHWLNRAVNSSLPEPENDAFDEDPHVLIAGFGRFGQVVGRVLNANGFRTSVLENSVEQITLLRRFDRRVHYGDASRMDLLHAAGAEKARALVIAIDDPDRAVEMAKAVREEFPHLTVLARAFDRRHAYNLLDAGAHVVEREAFEGSLAMAAETLRSLGWRAYRAEKAARLFRLHDEKLFNELRPIWGDEEKFRVAVRESSPRMDDLLRADLRQLGDDGDDDGITGDDPEPRPAGRQG